MSADMTSLDQALYEQLNKIVKVRVEYNTCICLLIDRHEQVWTELPMINNQLCYHFQTYSPEM